MKSLGRPESLKALQAALDTSISIFDLLNEEIPERPWLLWPFLQACDIGMISAETGLGKSYLALSFALAMVYGKSFLHFEPLKATGVLWIEGELLKGELQARLRRLMAGMGEIPEPAPFRTLIQKNPAGGFPSLDKPAGQKIVEAVLKQNPELEVVFLDSVSELCAMEDENSISSWMQFNRWLGSLVAMGYTIILVHHANRGGDFRGSTAANQTCSQHLHLTKISGSNEEGSCFKVQYQKKRGLADRLALKPYSLALVDPLGGDLMTSEALAWERKELRSRNSKNELRDQIVELANGGMMSPEIIKTLEGKATAPTIYGHITKALADGSMTVDPRPGRWPKSVN